MRRTDTAFSVSLYPPVRQYVLGWIEKLKGEGILFREPLNADIFAANMTIAGDSDRDAAEAHCPVSGCATFEDGRISKCPKVQRIPVYAGHYGLEGVFPDSSLDLYSEGLTAAKLYSYLMEPVELCRFCGRLRVFPWTHAGREPAKEDWYGNGRIGE